MGIPKDRPNDDVPRRSKAVKFSDDGNPSRANIKQALRQVRSRGSDFDIPVVFSLIIALLRNKSLGYEPVRIVVDVSFLLRNFFRNLSCFDLLFVSRSSKWNRLLLIDVPLTTMIRMCYVVTFANLNLVIMVPQRLSPLCSSCMKARTLIFMGAMVFWLCYGTPSLESIIIENLSVVRELADVFHNDSWDFLPTREIEFWN
ncbi:hypothetical protein Tco_0702541 [Tanacetum coccineum]|uniref:Uncharacterized protein n=1 Tax=Tanacetum coccineum TaxID=301880 RepID=A0ABQ4XY30_9ASTR